jgi:membrane protein YdbS with pleckstrin-like domain
VAFPGRLLSGDEYVLVTSRAHGKTLTGPVLVLLLTTFLGTFAAGRAGRDLRGPARTAAVGVLAVLAFWLVVRRVLVPFLRWLTTTYTFTNRRFVARSGVLAREGRTVPLDRVAALDVERGLLDRLLGCGTLVVTDAGEDGRFALPDLPRVEEVQTRVADQVHRLRHEVLVRQEVGEGGTGDLRLDHRP